MNLLIPSPKQRLASKSAPDRPGWVPAGLKKWESDPYDRLRFTDRRRGEQLRDMGELLEALDEKTAELTALQTALAQKKAIRQAAEAELAQLKTKLQS